MSIKEPTQKSKPLADTYAEEEFDLVPKGGNGLFTVIIRHIILVLLIVLAAGGAFGIGRISHYENVIKPLEVKSSDVTLPYQTASVSQSLPITQNSKISKPASVKTIVPAVSPVASSTNGTVVASKTGTKYYFPWCGGAKRILDANKVYYHSSADARKAGLTPSSTCKGLQ